MKIKIRNLNYMLMYVFLLGIVFFPAGIIALSTNMDVIVTNFLLPVAFFMTLLIYLKKNAFFSVPIISILLLRLVIIITTYMNAGSLYIPVIYLMKIMIVIMVFEIALENDFNTLCQSLYIIFLPILIINLLLMCISPQGIGVAHVLGITSGYIRVSLHFIGNKNNFSFILIPLMSIQAIDFYLYKRRTSILIFIICMISIFLSKSSTGIIACTVLVIFVIMTYLLKKIRLLNISNISIVYFTLTYLIVFLRIQENFSSLFETLFSKNATFSMRSTIWIEAIQLIREKFIWGYGGSNSGAIIPNIGVYWYAHNQVLDTFIQSGVVGFCVGIIFLIFLILSQKKVGNIKLRQIYLCGCISIGVIMISESLLNNSVLTYGFLILGFYLKKLRYFNTGEIHGKK